MQRVDSVDCVDAVVVGAGVVGLAVARALVLSPKFAGKELLVLEATNAFQALRQTDCGNQ